MNLLFVATFTSLTSTPLLLNTYTFSGTDGMLFYIQALTIAIVNNISHVAITKALLLFLVEAISTYEEAASDTDVCMLFYMH